MEEYSALIHKLNSLQSRNVSFSTNEQRLTRLKQMKNYLTDIGLSMEQIEQMPIVHVAGTKGKGSTCLYTEAILRHHGYKTGLFTSPHLICVRERIKMDGVCVSVAKFTSYFKTIFEILENNQCNNMPTYFQFLTILAFYIFIKENVDVAVIETGVGGEYDSTNFLEKPAVTGITSLGLDHTNVLGDSISKIAWHKGGIFKSSSECFTVFQEVEAHDVLTKRAKEKGRTLNIVPTIDTQGIDPVLSENASLSLAMCKYLLLKLGTPINNYRILLNIIKEVPLPGRFQIIKRNHVTWYLDGAHTDKSLKHTVSWFLSNSKLNKKVLVANITKNRDFTKFLTILSSTGFEHVIFTTNIVNKKINEDLTSVQQSLETQVLKCRVYSDSWLQINPGASVETVAFVEQALELVKDECDVLVTGSFHLVGSVLSVLDPELTEPVHHSISQN